MQGVAGVEANVGDVTAPLVEEAASDDVLEEEVVDVELTELPVPRRTSCLSPATCDVRRVGERGPEDQENSGEAGGEAHGSAEVGSWWSLRTTMRLM